MVTEWSMTQAIKQAAIQATKVAIMAHRKAVRPIQVSMRICGPTLNQPTIDLKAPNKYHDQCSLEIEVKIIFLTNNYNIQAK